MINREYIKQRFFYGMTQFNTNLFKYSSITLCKNTYEKYKQGFGLSNKHSICLFQKQFHWIQLLEIVTKIATKLVETLSSSDEDRKPEEL